MDKQNTFFYLIIIWIAIAIVVFPILLFVKQPYGRHFSKGWGPSITNKFGWILMEMPSLAILTFYFAILNSYSWFVALLFSLWFIHYFNRTLIFPFRIKTKGKKMPLIIVGSAILFNIANASFNGLELSRISEINSFSTIAMIRIAVGLFLFFLGMFINISSDNILIRLRKSSTNGYKIPTDGLFKWVSCPNYMGEIIEWLGFAIIAFNLAALSFAIWTIVNLVPRALDHHKWYRQTFQNYPVERKAVLPFIL